MGTVGRLSFVLVRSLLAELAPDEQKSQETRLITTDCSGLLGTVGRLSFVLVRSLLAELAPDKQKVDF